MAEVKTLTIPPSLYDFVLYYECANKDWLKGAKKTAVNGDGGLRDMIDWNSTYSYDPDDAGGKTLFGMTEATWGEYVRLYPNKGYSKNLNSMGKQGWHDGIDWFWNTYSYAGQSANHACAFIMFQMSWGGFNSSALSNMLNVLKENADKKDYSFIKGKASVYKKIADATHAYTDPMVAYDYMRKLLAQYYYNISTPDRTNKKYRNGWLTRSALSFTPYGLYIPTTVSYKTAGLKYESTLDQWEDAANRLAQNNTIGYVKIIDWGVAPESVEKMSSNSYEYLAKTNPSTTSSGSSSSSSSGAYGGCGGVSQLGSYSNNASYSQQSYNNTATQSREQILNTLISGSYTPNDVKKCAELTSAEKKKGVKTKSES